MKCVCPMGGDRTCPDDCTPARRAAFRKTIAETLYKQNHTMEQIATQLGVATWTISKDLRDFSPEVKIKTAKTASNPKGAGRPKGTRKARTTTPTAEAVAAALVLDEGKTLEQAAKEIGRSVHIVKTSVAREEGRREAEPTITPDMLSMTAQQKLDSAIRQHKQKLDAEFHKRVNARVQEFLMDTILPQHRKEQAVARKIIESRRGIMDKATFNKVRRGLHPDSRNSISDKVLGEAFDAFMALEKRLLNEQDSPTTFIDIPHTPEELARAREQAMKARKAKQTTTNTLQRRH